MEYKIKLRSRENSSECYCTPVSGDPVITQNITGGDKSSDNPLIVQLQIENKTERPWEGVIRYQLYFNKKNPRFFMPAFLYGRNRGEYAANICWCYPRLHEEETKLPYSPWWMVRSDRLSHPASLVFDSGRVYGISASPYLLKDGTQTVPWTPERQGVFYQYAGFGCSLEEGFTAYTIGYENAPYLFINSDTIEDRKPLGKNCIRLEAGEKFTVSLQIYDYAAETPLGINQAIEHIYGLYHQEPRKGSTCRQTVEDLAAAIAEDAWRPEGKNYATQVYQEENGAFTYHEWFSISWTGGVETAVPMLMAGLRLNREDMREQALICIQDVADHSMNPASGLPYDACNNGIWSVDGWWRGHMHAKGHTSYLIGQAVCYILKGYVYEKKLKGIEHQDWLDFAGRVIAKMETTKNSDGEYPYIWSEKTGAGLEYDAFSGNWCMAAAAYYCYLSKDKKWLPGLRESEQHYYKAYVRQMECYATPIDTDKAVDSEGILAYLKAVRYLHEMTKEAVYLEHMRDGFAYEFSFKFCYNSPVQVPPLSRLGWSSCGGSVTSTCNPHIHPMSNLAVDELLYYLHCTKDDYVQMRLEDTVRWGCQTYNTAAGEYDYGKKGWMSERFCHSEALLVERYPNSSPASTWFALLPWGGANIIEGLTGAFWDRKLEEEGILSDKRKKRW